MYLKPAACHARRKILKGEWNVKHYFRRKKVQIIRGQWNKQKPQVFEASRTQVNINIRQEARIIDGVSINGYSYDTVIEDANSLDV